MLQYLRHKFESKHRISVERVVSGIGLFNVRHRGVQLAASRPKLCLLVNNTDLRVPGEPGEAEGRQPERSRSSKSMCRTELPFGCN
jgi:glucokinase